MVLEHIRNSCYFLEIYFLQLYLLCKQIQLFHETPIVPEIWIFFSSLKKEGENCYRSRATWKSSDWLEKWFWRLTNHQVQCPHSRACSHRLYTSCCFFHSIVDSSLPLSVNIQCCFWSKIEALVPESALKICLFLPIILDCQVPIVNLPASCQRFFSYFLPAFD